MTALTKLYDQLKYHHDAGREIFRKADEAGRWVTAAEEAEIQRHVDEGLPLLNQVKTAKADAKVRKMLADLGPDLPDGAMPGGYASTSGFKAGGSDWARRVAGQVTAKAMASGTKDIAVGNLGVPNLIEVAVEIPARPLRLLDLIPTKPLPGPTYAYMKQTLRQSNAAPVPDHGLKPTSQYLFEQIEGKASVFAHITDPIASRFFDDFNELMTLLDQQLYVDLRRAIEDDIAAGDGTGEHFTGLTNTSGVYNQPYTTSLPATLRAARVTLEVANETPTSWLVNPADLAALDLLADTQGRFYTSEVNALMGNLPRVASTSIPAGRAILGDWSMARLYVRQEASLALDGGGLLFTKNEFVMRYEGRYAFAVLRPAAFNIVDLTP